MDYQFHLWPQDRYANLDEVAKVIVAAEELGYAAVAGGEHILVPTGPEMDVIGRSYYDPMVLFARLAAATKKINLQFCAIVMPYRHPALTARGIASLDHASNGRFTLVVGSGWAPGEFGALGIPWETRGAMTDEYVDVMRTLWTEDSPSYSGRFVNFPEVVFEPKCVQKPHVPLWVGGGGAVARRRMAEWGEGWIPMVATVDEMRQEIAAMREAVADAGRDPEALEFAYHITYKERDPYHMPATESVSHATAIDPIAGSPEEAIEMASTYADAGITRVQLQLRWDGGPDQLIERLQEFSEDVMPHTAGL